MDKKPTLFLGAVETLPLGLRLRSLCISSDFLVIRMPTKKAISKSESIFTFPGTLDKALAKLSDAHVFCSTYLHIG